MKKIIQLGNLRKDSKNFTNPQTGRVYSENGIAPTINTCQGGEREPKVVVKNMKFVCERRMDEGLRTFRDGVVGTIRTIDAGGDKRVIENNSASGYRIRKLTPRECWRLMDFTDSDFDSAKWYSKEESKALLEKHPNHKRKRQFTEEERIERISDTQLYKQAGNSICVGVLYYIFKELYEVMPYLFDDLKVSSYFSGIGAFESALDRLYENINSGNFTTPHGV